MLPAPPTPAVRHRFHLLDALRGIAAVLVVFVHLPAYLQTRISPGNDFLAVDFFFCLSGFVMAHAYERRLEAGLPLRAFLQARFIRLYPIYFLSTLLGIISLDFFDHGLFRSSGIQLTGLALLLLPNFSSHLSPLMFPLDLPAWSLFFEILVNVAFALVARGRGMKVLWLVLCMATSTTVLGVWLMHGQLLGQLGFRSRFDWFGYDLARTALSFAAGLLLSKLFRAGPRPLPCFCSSPKMGPVAAIAVLLFLTFLLRAPIRAMETITFQLLCLIALFPAVIWCGAHCSVPRRWKAGCSVLGDASYPLYLLHVPLLRVFGTRHVGIYAAQHPRAALPICFASVAFPSLVALAASQLFEKPLREALFRGTSREYTATARSAS